MASAAGMWTPRHDENALITIALWFASGTVCGENQSMSEPFWALRRGKNCDSAKHWKANETPFLYPFAFFHRFHSVPYVINTHCKMQHSVIRISRGDIPTCRAWPLRCLMAFERRARTRKDIRGTFLPLAKLGLTVTDVSTPRQQDSSTTTPDFSFVLQSTPNCDCNTRTHK